MVRRAPQTNVWPSVGAGVASLAVALALTGCQLTKAASPDVDPDLATTMAVGDALAGQRGNVASETVPSADEEARAAATAAAAAAEDEARRLSQELETAQAEARSAESRATAAEEEAAQARAAQQAAEASNTEETKLKATFPSWNPKSASLRKLVAFVEDVCDETSPNYVPVEDRVATFDMDGTVMSEKAPIYLDWMLLMHRVLDDPTYTADTQTRALCEDLRDHLTETFEDADSDRQKNYDLTAAFRGMTPKEFRDYVEDFVSTTNVVGFSNMTYGESLYQPMVEVVDYLHENDFNVYMVSACERDVVRAVVRSRLDIPNDHVIGVDFSIQAQNQGGLSGNDYNMAQNERVFYGGISSEPRGKMNKVVQIEQEIGIRPILAFGNSSGDFSMLNYAQGNPDYKGMGVLVVCDDTTREYGDAAKAADYMKSVTAEGWLPFSMRDDWATIYKESVEKTSVGESVELTTTERKEDATETEGTEEAEATEATEATEDAETTETAETEDTETTEADETAEAADEAEEARPAETAQVAAKATGTATASEDGQQLDLGSADAGTDYRNLRVRGEVVLDDQTAA